MSDTGFYGTFFKELKRLGYEAMMTRDVRTFQDKNGTAYGQQMYNLATEGQISEITYMSSIPGLTEQVAKRAFITRIGDQVCGVSAYQFKATDQQ